MNKQRILNKDRDAIKNLADRFIVLKKIENDVLFLPEIRELKKGHKPLAADLYNSFQTYKEFKRWLVQNDYLPKSFPSGANSAELRNGTFSCKLKYADPKAEHIIKKDMCWKDFVEKITPLIEENSGRMPTLEWLRQNGHIEVYNYIWDNGSWKKIADELHDREGFFESGKTALNRAKAAVAHALAIYGEPEKRNLLVQT